MSQANKQAKSSGPKRGFWADLRWGLPFLAALLPIILLSLYSYRVSSESVRDFVEVANESAAANLSQLITQDFTRTVSLAHALASIPGTVEAAKKMDETTMNQRLQAIVSSYPYVDRAFVTDRKGMLWSDAPAILKQYRKNLSLEDWYLGVSREWRPYISEVYIRQSETPHPVVAIAVPIRDGNGSIIGTLVLEYHVNQVTRWLQSIRLGKSGHLYVVDHTGTIIGHPFISSEERLYEGYATEATLEQATMRGIFNGEYIDPLRRQEMVATFLPISMGHNKWVIVAQQPMEEAYERLNRVKVSISVAGGILTLFTLAMVIALARITAHNEGLNRELRKKNQALRELASIVETSNDAIVGQSLEGVVKSWNAAAEQMYGYKSYEVIGESIATVVPEDRREELQEFLRKVNAGQSIQQYETVRIRKDKKQIFVSLTLSPVRDADGKIIDISSIDQDITARKKIEQMKDDFISFVSHQLKAPVTGIRWTLDSIMTGDFGAVPPELQKPLKQLQDISAQNYHLITDLLNVSRIERGVIAVEIAPAPLKDVMERALRDYRVPIEKAGLELKIEGLDHNVTVLVDKEKMAEAVTNSISNAIKHTKKGSITVRMSAKEGFGFIEVSDTGDGMTPDIIEKLFTRDQILGESASSEKSAGLGLYIAKNFMTIQGGDVWADSKAGKGSTFTYKIPMAGSTKGESFLIQE